MGPRVELAEADLPFVLALETRRGIWAGGQNAHPCG